MDTQFHSLEGPFIHFTINNELFQQHYDQLVKTAKSDLFHTMIDGKDCLSTKALFKTFSKKLAFPDYFGKNWDAFNECINDLEWLDYSQYVVFFKNFEQTLTKNNDELAIFLNIIEEAIQEWAEGVDRLQKPFHLVIQANEDLGGKLSNHLKATVTVF